ncbi:MAG: hypothetical protein QE279_12545 [Rhodoferax sp.]|nr:hypothetical protein [Rhodoferax sp.]
MTAIAINAFRGEVPRTESRLLNGNFAKKAKNTKLYSGRLDVIKGPTVAHNSLIASSIQTMYRYRKDSDYRWLVFGVPVSVARSPAANDVLGRFYYTGDGEPRMSTYADAIQGPGLYPFAFYVLGVTPPDAGAGLTVTGGSGATEVRAYVQTFVTQYGEESGPSPAIVLTGFVNGSWDFAGFKAPPANTGTVTSASMSGSTCSVVLNTVYGIEAGERLTIAGTAGIAGLNATHTLESVNAGTNTVTLTLSATGTAGAGTWARQARHNTTSMKRRIYRTVGTGTDYKFVAEIDATNAGYSDTIPAPGAAITSLNVRTPPKRMTSIVALANGALAGLNGNELCLSEQYKPHSWPTSNRYSFAALGVTLIPAGNAVIVLTDTNPYVATASIPEAASLTRMETYAPCINARGVVDIGAGAMYPSHDGLYLITPSDAVNFTEKLYRLNEWEAEEPGTFVAAYHDQTYYAIKGAGETRGIFALDVKEPDSVCRLTGDFSALYANPFDGVLYAASGNRIFSLDSNNQNRAMGEWESREYALGHAINLGAAKVKADFSQVTPVDAAYLAANQALLNSKTPIGAELGMSALNALEINGSLLAPNPNTTANFVRFLLKSGEQVLHSQLVQNGEAFRLPSGFKKSNYTLTLEFKIPVFGMAVASTMKELENLQI